MNGPPTTSCNAGDVLPDLADVVPNTDEFPIKYQFVSKRLIVEFAGGNPDVVEGVIEVASVDKQERAFHVHRSPGKKNPRGPFPARSGGG